MSTASLPLQRARWLRPKYLLFTFIVLMVAYVLRHNEHFLIDAKDPEWAHIHPFRCSFSFAAGTDAVLWMLTTAVAIFFIFQGKVQQHRQWMTRSFAVAIVFLEVRVVGGVTGWENLGDSVNETMVWMCVAFSLLFADLLLQWRDFSTSRPVPARAPSASD